MTSATRCALSLALATIGLACADGIISSAGRGPAGGEPDGAATGDDAAPDRAAGGAGGGGGGVGGGGAGGMDGGTGSTGGGGGSGGGAGADGGGIETPPASGGRGMDCLAAHNTLRAKSSLPAMVWDDKLACAAVKHSEDMVARNYEGHISPDGEDPLTRCTKCGGFCDAENIAFGYDMTTCQKAVDGWLTSPGHKAIMLRTSNKRIGCGWAGGGKWKNYWTCAFSSK